MKSFTRLSDIVTIICAVSPVIAQTYSQCNPLQGGNCPPNSALGKSVSIDFTSGESDSFTPQGNPTYDSNGASFTVTRDGDAPQLNSKWYIMFGHVEFVIKAAPGNGIVSSAVLQSDTLDEIDWEWLGGDNGQVQTNYFGQGKTLSYNRGAFHPASGNHDGFKTYTIDWTADRIIWSIDGTSVRELDSSTATEYPYPQTPMMVKVGAWCGGCPSNAPGTQEWAGGAPTFGSGGSAMQLKSISVEDYSTGSQYQYSGTDGTWQSITAVGGSVNSKGGKGSSSGRKAPVVSASTNSGPMPFQGTHSDKSSTVAQPNSGAWSPTTLQTSATPTVTTYPGLPAGWTVTSSGKVLPPSAAPVTPPPTSPSSSPADSQQESPDGSETETIYDGQGFPIVVNKAADGASVEKHYDEKGFLMKPEGALESRASPTSQASNTVTSDSSDAEAVAASVLLSSTPGISKSTSKPDSGATKAGDSGMTLCIAMGLLIAAPLL